MNAPVARREATLQAAFLGLDAILPKAFTKQRTAATSTTRSQDSTPVGGAQRYASSREPPNEDGSKPAWHEWIFGPDSKKGGEPLKEGDIRVRLEEESGSIFQKRSMTAKAALDPRLRCTEVDGSGKVIMVDGELKKSELIARVRNVRTTPNGIRLLTVLFDSMASFHAISARSTRPTSLTFSSARQPSFSTFST
jgi:magnesium transporter